MTPSIASEQSVSIPNSPASSKGWSLVPRRMYDAFQATVAQGMPLFRREMLVQSLRIRTYAVRAAFAVILFAVAIIYTAFVTNTPLIGAAVRLPGQGMVILHALVWMLFGFIYLYGPATTSGVITLEKERQTLVLLYLTKLTPWHIILEKFLSRLLPLLGSLLLALPLLVFAYAFGGVSPEMLGTSVWFLLVTAVQVTAVAVFCSTICQRTTQAFVLTYFGLMCLYWGPALVKIWLSDPMSNTSSILWPEIDALPVPNSGAVVTNPLAFTAPRAAIPTEYALFACFPTRLFVLHYGPAIAGGTFQWDPMFVAGYPTLLSAFCALVLARLMLFYRAFAENRFNPLQRWKLLAGRLWIGHQPATEFVASKPAVLKDIPNQPIAWRESAKGLQNWMPFLLLLEVPSLAMAFWLAKSYNDRSQPISVEIFVLWVIGALLISIQASSTFNRERNQQTLELLLATPLSSAEIVQQKFNGIRRLMLIVAIPLLSCIAFQSYWRAAIEIVPIASPVVVASTTVHRFYWWEYLITSTMCVVIYFQLIGWIALWAGMKYKSSARAMLEALGGILALCGAPAIVLGLPLIVTVPIQLLVGLKFLYLLVSQLSPVAMIALAEFTNIREICNVPLLPMIANTIIYGLILLKLRRYILERADILLGRTVNY